MKVSKLVHNLKFVNQDAEVLVWDLGAGGPVPMDYIDAVEDSIILEPGEQKDEQSIEGPEG